MWIGRRSWRERLAHRGKHSVVMLIGGGFFRHTSALACMVGTTFAISKCGLRMFDGDVRFGA